MWVSGPEECTTLATFYPGQTAAWAGGNRARSPDRSPFPPGTRPDPPRPQQLFRPKPECFSRRQALIVRLFNLEN